MSHYLESPTTATSNPEKHNWSALYWCEWPSDLSLEACADGIVSDDGSPSDGMCLQEDGEKLKWVTSRPVSVSVCEGPPSRYSTTGYKRLVGNERDAFRMDRMCLR
jgi:hypothetical protein